MIFRKLRIIIDLSATATNFFQKQPPEVFCKISVLKNFGIFAGKHLYRSLFLIKLEAFRIVSSYFFLSSPDCILTHFRVTFYFYMLYLYVMSICYLMSHDTEEWCKISKDPNLLFENWQELSELWSKHSKVSKIFNLIGPFCAKYITLDSKKYRGVIFNDTEESFKI